MKKNDIPIFSHLADALFYLCFIFTLFLFIFSIYLFILEKHTKMNVLPY